MSVRIKVISMLAGLLLATLLAAAAGKDMLVVIEVVVFVFIKISLRHFVLTLVLQSINYKWDLAVAWFYLLFSISFDFNTFFQFPLLRFFSIINGNVVFIKTNFIFAFFLMSCLCSTFDGMSLLLKLFCSIKLDFCCALSFIYPAESQWKKATFFVLPLLLVLFSLSLSLSALSALCYTYLLLVLLLLLHLVGARSLRISH